MTAINFSAAIEVAASAIVIVVADREGGEGSRKVRLRRRLLLTPSFPRPQDEEGVRRPQPKEAEEGSIGRQWCCRENDRVYGTVVFGRRGLCNGGGHRYCWFGLVLEVG